LHGLAIPSINNLPDGLQIARLSFVEQFSTIKRRRRPRPLSAASLSKSLTGFSRFTEPIGGAAINKISRIGAPF